MKHILKTIEPYYSQVVAGKKRFEVRKDDRNFQVGDMLELAKYDPVTGELYGDSITRVVTAKLDGGQFGIEPGYCVLGIELPLSFTPEGDYVTTDADIELCMGSAELRRCPVCRTGRPLSGGRKTPNGKAVCWTIQCDNTTRSMPCCTASVWATDSDPVKARADAVARWNGPPAPSSGLSIGQAVEKRGIYCASKTRHASMWRKLRDAGWPIISTWIDEAGEGQSSSLADLSIRCISEPASAKCVLLYAEEGDELKGALIECGAALASGTLIICVGESKSLSRVFNAHPLWIKTSSMHEAETVARNLLATDWRIVG